MIIEGQADVTKAVLSELERAPDPRFREIMSALVRHLHDFAREVKLTEQEFQTAAAYVNALGKLTNDNHNEAVLMAGSLGLSALVCLLNNGDHGQTETDASQLGPFWRMHSPLDEERQFHCAIADARSRAFLSTLTTATSAASRSREWKSTSGIHRRKAFENQDPTQSDMNLRGKFITENVGGAYQLPQREAVRLARFRSMARWVIFCARSDGTICVPAHLHYLAYKVGFKTLISQIYPPDDKYIDSRRAVRRHASPAGRFCAARRWPGAGRRRQAAMVFARATTSSWKPARRACRGRRSPARLKGNARKFRISNEPETNSSPVASIKISGEHNVASNSAQRSGSQCCRRPGRGPRSRPGSPQDGCQHPVDRCGV